MQNSSSSRSLFTVLLFSLSLGADLEARQLGYATATTDDKVFIFDVASNTLLKGLSVGSRPARTVVVPSGVESYTSNFGSGTISVIDAATQNVSATIEVGGQPFGIAFDPAGTTAYVTNAATASVDIVETATRTVSGHIQVTGNLRDVVMDSTGSRLYVARTMTNGVGGICIIDVPAKALLTCTTIPGDPIGIVLRPKSPYLYTVYNGSTSSNYGYIAVMAVSSGQIIRTVQTRSSNPRQRATGFAMNTAGTEIYVAGDSSIAVFDTASGTIRNYWPENDYAQAIEVHPDDKYAYLASASARLIRVYDLKNGNASNDKKIDLTGFPAAITLGPDLTLTVSSQGIVNSASYDSSAVVPGSLASVFGTFPLVPGTSSASSSWPLSLAGVSVTFDGIPAPIYFVSAGQLNVQVPWELAGKTEATVTVAQTGFTPVSQKVSIAPAGPGIFQYGSSQGVVVDAISGKLLSPANPGRPGETYIAIYCTGLGPVSNQPGTGATASASALSPTFSLPVATIGGVSAKILFSGLAPGFTGLYQVNVQIPANTPTGDSVPLIMSVAGRTMKAVYVPIASPPVVTRTITVTLKNKLGYDVDFSADGKVLRRVPSGAQETLTYSAGSTLNASYSMIRPTLNGQSLGDVVAATYDPITNPAGSYTFEAKATIGTSRYFMPIVTNQTSVALLLGVNMGLAAENKCNCTAPAGQKRVAFGYYRFYSNSNVRGYRADTGYSGAYAYFGSDSAASGNTIGGVDSESGVVELSFTTAPAATGSSGGTGSTGNGGSSGGSGGNPAPTAFIQHNSTLAKRGDVYLEQFTVTATSRLVFRFASSYSAQAAIISSSLSAAFQNGQSVSAYASFESQIGTLSVTLGPGSYVLGVRNSSSTANYFRYELDYDVVFPGLSRAFATSVSDTVSANGGRAWVSFTIQAGARYWIDGCNTNLDVFILPESELSNFTGGRQFSYYSDYSGLSAAELPGADELKLPPGKYYVAFRNPQTTPGAYVMTLEAWQ